MQTLKNLRATLNHDRWVLPLFGAYKKPFVLAVALGVLTFVFASALMFTSGYLVSASAVVASVLMLHIPLMCVQIFGLGRPILSYFERLTSHDWVFRITTLLRGKLYRTLEPHGIFYRASVRLGDTLGLLTEDIGHIQDLYLRSIFPMVIAGVLYLLLAMALGFFSIPLMLLELLVVGCAVFVLPLLSVAFCGPKHQLIKHYTHLLYEDLTDAIQGANDVLYAGRAQEIIDELETTVAQRSKIQSWLVAFDHGRDFLLQLCFLIMILAITIWAALTFGGSAHAHTDALNWIAAFSIAFFPLIDALALVPGAAVAGADKLSTIARLNDLDTLSQKAAAQKYAIAPPDAKKANETLALHGFSLKLENVSFSYAQSSTPALQDISFEVPEGQKLMIIGASGAGKSSLGLLLRGDLTPDTGTATLGDISLSSFGDDIAQHMCVIAQDPHLFDLTVAENLRLANPRATDEDIWAVLEAVQLKDLILNLPGRLQERMGESAYGFSGGEQQRLSLARALLSPAPILLLDEATSALDPKTEEQVLSCILAGWRDKTIIFISHHLIMAPAFDRILNLQEGTIAYCDSFASLMQGNPHFRTLYGQDSANDL